MQITATLNAMYWTMKTKAQFQPRMEHDSVILGLNISVCSFNGESLIWDEGDLYLGQYETFHVDVISNSFTMTDIYYSVIKYAIFLYL